MKITLITLVYNEQERLPFFLRHYNLFVDNMIIYLNTASNDRSEEILRNNPNTKIIPYDTGGLFNENKNQEIKNETWKELDSDWFIVCDADEYLYSYEMPRTRVILQSYLDIGVTLPYMEGWQMVGDPMPENDGKSQIYDFCKHGARYDRLLDLYPHSSHKQIIFHKDAGIVYGPGGHNYITKGRMDSSHDVTFKILHYRYFTFNHVWNFYKNLNANPEDKHTFSWTKSEQHIRRMYNWFYSKRERVIP